MGDGEGGAGPGTRRRPGRPRSLTPEAIGEAAVAVGFPDLSVSEVARVLGVNHATLYRYVHGREELAGLAVDRIFSAAERPEPDGDWRSYLEATVWAVWDLFDAHPGLAEEFSALPPYSPALVEWMNTVSSHLVELGFDPRGALLACDIVVDMACDSHSGWERMDAWRAEGSRRQAMRSGFVPRVAAEFRPAVSEMVEAVPREWFAAKLEVALAGVAAKLAPRLAPN